MIRLHKLTLRDKSLFNRYLGLSEHELSVYSFENIYIWKGLFQIYWAISEGGLCVFFQDPIGAFLYLPALAKKITPQLIRKIFATLDSLNRNNEVSRIENVEEKDADFYRALGFNCERKSVDYICLRQDLAGLKGNKFKSKRACLNHFLKHYEFKERAYQDNDRQQCLRLYRSWAKERSRSRNDHIYQAMLEDSFSALEVLLRNFKSLDCIGRVIKVKGQIRAFTFGYPLNRETFCILYEVADLSFKGIAQFIFREFCAQAKGFKYINLMDDSGLKNLAQVKLSYKPVKLAPAFIVKRKNANTY